MGNLLSRLFLYCGVSMGLAYRWFVRMDVRLCLLLADQYRVSTKFRAKKSPLSLSCLHGADRDLPKCIQGTRKKSAWYFTTRTNPLPSKFKCYNRIIIIYHNVRSSAKIPNFVLFIPSNEELFFLLKKEKKSTRVFRNEI